MRAVARFAHLYVPPAVFVLLACYYPLSKCNGHPSQGARARMRFQQNRRIPWRRCQQHQRKCTSSCPLVRRLSRCCTPAAGVGQSQSSCCRGPPRRALPQEALHFESATPDSSPRHRVSSSAAFAAAFFVARTEAQRATFRAEEERVQGRMLCDRGLPSQRRGATQKRGGRGRSLRRICDGGRA